jgi:lipopolysaccharide export system ATP-binding protein
LIFDSIFYSIKDRSILNGVYLKVDPGKICGIFGRNGTGKSTLIKIGAGIILPTSGTVFIDGQVFLDKARMARYEKIAYLCQDSFLPKDLAVKKFLEIHAKQKELLHDDFSNLSNLKIRNLSGGERKLLELAFIISLNRPYMLLDEPFTGIEPKIIDRMIELISKQRDDGKGILITDHYHRYITKIVDSAYLLKNGNCKLIADRKCLDSELREQGYLKL